MPHPPVYYYVQGFLGSARVITQADGTPCYRADHTPYGREMVYLDSCPQNYKFTGKERDPETGLDNFHVRYYASSYGRFISPDPLGTILAQSGGSALRQHELNPEDWNMYEYVLDNPESLTDPTGMHAACTRTSKTDTYCTPDTSKTKPQQKAQEQNANTPAPTNPNGTPQPPPTPPPPGASGKPNEWVRVPGTEGRPDKWVPRDPVPSPKGGQPGASWDEKGGHWDIDNGTGQRTRYLPDGTKVDHNNRPIPLSTVEKVGFWTTVGAVTVRVGVAVGRAVAACVESGACEAPF